MCVSEWRIAEGFFFYNDDLCESAHNKCKEAVRETPTFHRIIGRHVKSSACFGCCLLFAAVSLRLNNIMVTLYSRGMR